MTSIDQEIHKMAQDKGLNISKVLEEALNERMKVKTIKISAEESKCNFCGKETEKATNKNQNGLTFLWPDEKWICQYCLREISGKILDKK